MNQPKKVQFDQYAEQYESLHRLSVRTSGEEPEYFAAYKVSYMARRLAEASSQPLEILDFGCGVGGILRHLSRTFPGTRLHGLDVSEQSLQLASSSHPDVHFGLIQECALPMPDASVDVAIAACVYHHIAPAERLAWTRELKRILKPGGHLFIFEHNPLNPLTRKVVRDCPFDDDAILLPRHETEDLLSQSGFSDQDLDYIVFFPRPLGFLRPIEKFLGALPLGAQYVAHGRT